MNKFSLLLIGTLSAMTTDLAFGAASFISGQSGTTHIFVNQANGEEPKEFEGKSSRVHYQSNIPKEPIRYGVYLQSSSASNVQSGGYYFENSEIISTRGIGIETSMWLPSFRLVEIVAGISMQSVNFTEADNSGERNIGFTQGAAGRLGLAIAPTLGPISITVEASAEIARFVNGQDSADEMSYLSAVSYRSATILGGARMRF